MTINVILPGTIPGFRGRCGTCGCLFDCDPRDGEMEYLVIPRPIGSSNPPRQVRQLVVPCPTCSVTVHAKPIDEVDQ